MKKFLLLLLIPFLSLSGNPEISVEYQSVNVITGKYCESVTDLAAAKPGGVEIRRTYDGEKWAFNHPILPQGSRDQKDPAFAYSFDENRRLTSIRVLEGDDRIDIEYGDNDSFTLLQNGVPAISYAVRKSAPNRLHTYSLLEKVNGTTYTYQNHPTERQNLIVKRESPEGRCLVNEYYDACSCNVGGKVVNLPHGMRDFRIGRIKLQKAPVGEDETPITTARFFYYVAHTEVYDALNRKTAYRFSPEKVLTAVEKYADDGKLYRAERYFWDEKQQLVGICKENRDKTILSCKAYTYDDEGYLIKETLFGNLSGHCIIPVQLDDTGCPIENGVESCSTQYHYQNGLLAAELEENGKQIRYEYENGRVSAKMTGDGDRQLFRETYSYDTEGRIVRSTVEWDGEKRITDTSYRNGRVEEIREKFERDGEEVLLKATSFSYDLQGQPALKRVENGIGERIDEESFRYNEQGRLTEWKNSSGQCVAKSYDPAGNILFSDENGEEISFTYDYSNRIIAEEKGGELNRYRYDWQGNRTAAIDRYGNETTFEYDFCDRLVKTTLPQVTDENGTPYHPVFLQEWDEWDRIVAGTDSMGYRTETTYNCRGRPVSIHYPDGTRETFRYNMDGSLKSQTDKRGRTIELEYDPLGREVEHRLYDAEGVLVESRSKKYEGFHLVSESGTEGNTASYTYDEAGRLIKSTGKRPASYTYDSSGRLEAVQETFGSGEEEFGITRCIYDLEGVEKMWVESPAGDILRQWDKDEREAEKGSVFTETVRNDLGQEVLKKTTASTGGRLTATTYDALGRVVKKEIVSPFGEVLFEQRFSYDRAGNLVKDNTSTKRYGPCGRLEELIEGDLKASYTYNSIGLVESVVKNDGTAISCSYDAMGRAARVKSTDGTIDFAYTYHRNGKISEARDLIEQTKTVRSYDEWGRAVEETLSNNLKIGRRFDRKDRLTELFLPDGTSSQYRYDAVFLREVARNRLSMRYEKYSLKGKLEAADMIGGLGSIHYKRDERERISTIEAPFFSETISYGPEGLIDEIAVDGGISRYRYDDLNRLIDETAPDCQPVRYDLNGNISQKGEDSYRYDALGRLIAVTHGKTALTRFQYDPFNRRTAKKSYRKNEKTHAWELTGSLRYLYDDEREIGAVDDEGKIVELRILGVGHGAEIGASVMIELDGTPYAPIHDHRGSLVRLIDPATKKEAASYCYSPYGKAESTGPVQSPWQFSGKRIDPETGLIFFGKRYYDPSLQQWTTPDPLHHSDHTGPYSYADHNPLGNIDLYGLFSVKSLFYTTLSEFLRFCNFAHSLSFNLRTRLDSFDYIKPTLDKIGQHLVGKTFLHLAGFYSDKPECGIHGMGELNDNIRVTLINGILNARCNYKETLDQISSSHAGINVHYIFFPTLGWTWDLFRAVFTKFGAVPKQAYELAEIWRKMIDEVGGVGGEGKVLHYAHSIGGTITQIAKNLLTDEEQKMIDVITIGSATLIKNEGFSSVVNYLSKRDGVPLFDPIHYLKGLLGYDPHTRFIGSYLGIPFIDHPLTLETYSGQIEALGDQFVEQYL